MLNARYVCQQGDSYGQIVKMTQLHTYFGIWDQTHGALVAVV